MGKTTVIWCQSIPPVDYLLAEQVGEGHCSAEEDGSHHIKPVIFSLTQSQAYMMSLNITQ